MSNAAYFEAAIPEPFRVLGRKLQPFTLGHQILLERFDSSFSIGAEKAPTFEDLIFSVYICSYSYPVALRKVTQNTLFACFAIRLEMKLWSWRCGKFDVIEAMMFFREYVNAHSKEPAFWVEQKRGSASSGIPFIQFLKVKLEQELGYTEAEALCTPYQIAVWNYLTHLEGKGVIRFVSPEDQAAIESITPMEAKLGALARRVRPEIDAIERKLKAGRN